MEERTIVPLIKEEGGGGGGGWWWFAFMHPYLCMSCASSWALGPRMSLMTYMVI